MSSLRSSAGGRIPAGSIMTNERARNRQQRPVDPPPVGAAHEEVLGVREVRDRADALGPTGRGCRSGRRRSVAAARRPRRRGPRSASSASISPGRWKPSSENETTSQRAPGPLDQVGQRRSGLPAQVVGALARAAVGALARDPVVVGRVPPHERLPHVVVAEVGVLVVGRVDVRQVDPVQLGGQLVRVGAGHPPRRPRRPRPARAARARLRPAAPTASGRPSARRRWSRPGRRPRRGS